MRFREPGQRLLPRGMGAEEQHRRCREGPCELRLADRRPGRAITLTGRFPSACDQTARGDARLPPGATLAVMALRAEPEAQALAEARHGAPPVERVGVVRRGRVADGPRDVAEPLVIVTTPGQVDGDPWLPGGLGNPCGDAGAMGGVGHLRPHLREVVLTVRMWPGCEACRPLAHEMPAPTAQVAGRAPGGGIDGGRRTQAPAQQPRHLLRVTRVLLGLPAVEGFPRQRMAEDNWPRFAGPPVRQPGPR
jgi:hypothetical protein